VRILSFQEIIFSLQKFWSDFGCCILQPQDLEMGAGTFHPATALYAASRKFSWHVAYLQPCRRPTDSRFAIHPNRVQHYYQFQVLLKPVPESIQKLYLDSINMLGIGPENDIRFIEDDWKSPTLGAWGLGWEVQCNGMEISQFTYMQQLAGRECNPVLGEITYGLERVAMYIQNVNSIAEIIWHYCPDGSQVLYKDIDFLAEEEFSHFNTKYADVALLKDQFESFASECKRFVSLGLPLVAYDFCIKASHSFNLLDARGALSVIQREAYIYQVKALAEACSNSFLQKCDA
jgi:glycyl-tRNA synthetase alpha chain